MKESKGVFLNHLMKCEGIQRGISESPDETQAKPFPQVFKVPVCHERVTGSHHQTGGLG